MTRVAVIGAGWAGSAAALTLARSGVHVTVFEAAKAAGGRARKIEKDRRVFDNGQHLLLGAYVRSVAMIESLHVHVDDAVIRQPLALRTAPRSAPGLTMAAPRVTAPLHLLIAIAGATGLSISDKVSAVAWSIRNLGKKPIPAEMTVAELIAGQTPTVRRLLWEPLCIAALNTAASGASARVFVEVLRRAFTGDQAASDLVIPRMNLSQLLPEPALAEVVASGGCVHLGAAVVSVVHERGRVRVNTHDESLDFDWLVLATGPQHVARLLVDIASAAPVVAALRDFAFEPITTCHYEFACVSPDVDPCCPMLMLDGEPGQWLFWQRQNNGHWRASVVISAHHREGSSEDLLSTVLTQLCRSYDLPVPVWHQVVTEKRATYACTPKQSRVLSELPKRLGAIYLAGDWCVPELPATLEAAVISGENAAKFIIQKVRSGAAV